MKKAARARGAQAVEFALVLPFLVLIVLAVFDFFIFAYNKAVITNATREAARRATVLTTAAWSVADVRGVACGYMRGQLISAGSTGISAGCTGTGDPAITVTPLAAPAFNDPVTVTVSYSVRGFTLGSIWNLGASNIGAPFTVTASTQMLHE